MRSNRRFLALVFVGSCLGAAAACSLITDVDRSKIEGAGGTNGEADAAVGGSATGGSGAQVDSGAEDDAGNASDASASDPND
jgi:hypothetical protein